MCSRSTPYGFFAGWSLGKITENTALQSDEAKLEYTNRLDMNFMSELATTLERQQEIRVSLRYYPNTSIYKIGNRLRYVEAIIEERFRKYNLSSVSYSEYLESLLKCAELGNTIPVLATKLVSEDISEEVAIDFVNQLIDNQILVSELAASVTGSEFSERLIKIINEIPAALSVLNTLRCISELLSNETFSIEEYFTVWQLAQTIVISTEIKDLIQTDLKINLPQNTISRKTIELISDHVKKIWPVFDWDPSLELESFKRKFEEKYADAEVPLLALLDPEFGIPYGPYERKEIGNFPLIQGVSKTTKIFTTPWTPKQKLKYELLRLSMLENLYEVQLTNEHIAPFEKVAVSLPCSYYIIGTLLSLDSLQVDDGKYRFIFEGASGPSACNLMARFAHQDEDLKRHINEHLKKEQVLMGDAILAEIAHLPEARTGNILSRPHFRENEIVYLSSNDTTIGSIKVQDICVSIKNNRIVLRSKSLNKEILPRLTTAHNYHNSTLPVYKFLCDLQYQGVSGGISWNWGIFTNETFLPRLVYKSLIIAPATWNLKAGQLGSPSDIIAFTEVFRLFVEMNKMPSLVCLTEDDNHLVLNINDLDCLSLLYRSWCKHPHLKLTEYLQTEGQCPVKIFSEVFAHEIIIPCLGKPAIHINDVKKGMPLHPRKFSLGSEWLYLKVYSSISTADQILAIIIPSILKVTEKEQLLKSWFFIRYFDTGHHLRLRFHTAYPEAWQRVIFLLNESLNPLLNEGLIDAIQSDTYIPEINRYGVNLQVAEIIFHLDSIAISNSLMEIIEQNNEQLRWQFALKSVDNLLDDFEFSINEKNELLKLMQQSFFNEFGGSISLKRRLNSKYREDTEKIYAALESSLTSQLDFNINKRSLMMLQIIPKLIEPNKPKQFYYTFISDIIHMSLNRLFSAEQRNHELVVYHYLQKYYMSKLARVMKK
jgi:thiopeptide-type bacteriocin biosynthesis protein